MFQAPYVFTGAAAAAADGLPNVASRVLVNLLVDITAERCHPYWSLRPLTISHLVRLWPGPTSTASNPLQDRVRALRGATETELLWRIRQTLPDMDLVGPTAVPHQHAATVVNNGNCSHCAASLASATAKPPDLRQLTLTALTADDATAVLRIVPCLAAEILAGGWTQTFLHLVANGVLLDPQKQHANKSFEDRVTDLFSPLPNFGAPGAAPKPPVALIRKLIFDRPAAVSIPRTIPSVDQVALVSTASDVLLQLKDVPDQLSTRLQQQQRLDAASETWAAYLRLALPRQMVSLGDTWRIATDGTIESMRRPEHRRFWSVDDTGANLAKLMTARSRLTDDDQERLDACVTWTGLAIGLWGEAPLRSVALLWMALEALFGDRNGVYDRAPLPYLKRLPIELGYEIMRHMDLRRSKDKPTWISAVKHPKQCTVKQFLESLVQATAQLRKETLLHERATGVLALFVPGGRIVVKDRVQRDVQFMYAIRNGMAHSGKADVLGPLTHYLMNSGMEVLKATLGEVMSAAEATTGTLAIDSIVDACATWV